MIDFISRFFRREEASKNMAKERLRLILMSDRVSLAPDVFDAMKGEMLEVLRRYLDIDEHGMDVHFENAERQFALMANIPVKEVRTHDAIALARRPLISAPVEPATETAVAVAAPPRRRRRRRSRSTSVAAPQPELPQDPNEGSPPPAG